jgi:hypothetical protein
VIYVVLTVCDTGCKREDEEDPRDLDVGKRQKVQPVAKKDAIKFLDLPAGRAPFYTPLREKV